MEELIKNTNDTFKQKNVVHKTTNNNTCNNKEGNEADDSNTSFVSVKIEGCDLLSVGSLATKEQVNQEIETSECSQLETETNDSRAHCELNGADITKRQRNFRGRDISLREKNNICGMYKAGMSPKNIAGVVGLSVRQVYRWIQRCKEGRVNENLRKGSKKKLNQDQVDKIVQMMKENPLTSSTIIRDELNLNCSTRTVRRYLKERGFYTEIDIFKFKS